MSDFELNLRCTPDGAAGKYLGSGYIHDMGAMVGRAAWWLADTRAQILATLPDEEHRRQFLAGEREGNCAPADACQTARLRIHQLPDEEDDLARG